MSKDHGIKISAAVAENILAFLKPQFQQAQALFEIHQVLTTKEDDLPQNNQPEPLAPEKRPAATPETDPPPSPLAPKIVKPPLS